MRHGLKRLAHQRERRADFDQVNASLDLEILATSADEFRFTDAHLIATEASSTKLWPGTACDPSLFADLLDTSSCVLQSATVGRRSWLLAGTNPSDFLGSPRQ